MITIVIPTKNRPDFLLRLLDYYADRNFKHWIAIGDSSDSLIEGDIKKLQDRLNLIYLDCRGQNVPQAVKKVNRSIRTPYAALVADDDFLLPRGLEKCAAFLEDHPDHTAAHGQAVMISAEGGKASYYKQRPAEGETAVQRLLKHLSDYSVTLFSLHRTEVWKAMWEKADQLKDTTFAAELLPCCLSVLSGKIKQIKDPYLIRQVHERRYLLPGVFEWVTSPEWAADYRLFSDVLTEATMKKDGIGREAAQKAVKQAFWAYLNKILIKKYNDSYGSVISSWFKRLLRRAHV
jgi:glycosyltransferase domain-containing protein